MHNIVDLQLIKFQRGKKVVFMRDRCVTESHLMSPIRTKAIDCAFDCQGEAVSITAANLDDFIEDVLDARGLVHHEQATENSIPKS